MVDGERDSAETANPASDSKVGRVIQARDLAGLGEELERHWLGIGGERTSLRDLADEFNCRVLERALVAAGENPIEGEIENQYRLLTGDDVSARARTQVESKLSRLGIETESLRQDFVSHQAVHTYLTDVRGASLPEREPDATAAIQGKKETIMRLRNRLVAVTERSLESLVDASKLELGPFDVVVGIRVYCNDCDSTYELSDLLHRRSCECAG